MGLPEFKQVLDTMGPYLVSLGLGCLREPLVHPQIEELIHVVEAHDYVPGVTLATNGVLLDGPMAEFMVSRDLDWDIYISMESSNPATYEKIRRGAKFGVIKENIENLINLREKASKRMKINFCSVIFKYNLDEYVRLFDFAESIGIDAFKPMHLMLHEGNRDMALSGDEETRMFEIVNSLKQRTEDSHIDLMLDEFYEQRDYGLGTNKQVPMAVMNQTGHIFPPGYRKPIGSVLNDDDITAIMEFYGLHSLAEKSPVSRKAKA
jgi:MoaA/NifB/PqqE/SkfB family radical SAM enzyme